MKQFEDESPNSQWQGNMSICASCETVISIFKYHLFKQFHPMYLRTKENSIIGEYSKTPKEITVKDFQFYLIFHFIITQNECNAWFFWVRKLKNIRCQMLIRFILNSYTWHHIVFPLFFKCYPLRASAVSNIHTM